MKRKLLTQLRLKLPTISHLTLLAALMILALAQLATLLLRDDLLLATFAGVFFLFFLVEMVRELHWLLVAERNELE